MPRGTGCGTAKRRRLEAHSRRSVPPHRFGGVVQAPSRAVEEHRHGRGPCVLTPERPAARQDHSRDGSGTRLLGGRGPVPGGRQCRTARRKYRSISVPPELAAPNLAAAKARPVAARPAIWPVLQPEVGGVTLADGRPGLLIHVIFRVVVPRARASDRRSYVHQFPGQLHRSVGRNSLPVVGGTHFWGYRNSLPGAGGTEFR